MQAFLPEQRRSMRMDFRINGRPLGRPEKRTMRRACGLQSRCVGSGLRTAQDRRRLLPSTAASGGYALAANIPCGRIRFERRICLGRLISLLKMWGGEHILRGDRRERTDGAWSAGIPCAGHVSRGGRCAAFPPAGNPRGAAFFQTARIKTGDAYASPECRGFLRNAMASSECHSFFGMP